MTGNIIFYINSTFYYYWIPAYAGMTPCIDFVAGIITFLSLDKIPHPDTLGFGMTFLAIAKQSHTPGRLFTVVHTQWL
ncbi:MAG: hypothetical protein QMD11_09120 [Smithella sp.]|nr:hypothetical protein [Smithella sp.]